MMTCDTWGAERRRWTWSICERVGGENVVAVTMMLPTVVIQPPTPDSPQYTAVEEVSKEGLGQWLLRPRLVKSRTLDLAYSGQQDEHFLTVPSAGVNGGGIMQTFGFSVSVGSLLAWHDLYDMYEDEESGQERQDGGLLCRDKLPDWYGSQPLPRPEWYAHLPVSIRGVSLKAMKHNMYNAPHGKVAVVYHQLLSNYDPTTYKFYQIMSYLKITQSVMFQTAVEAARNEH